MEGRRQAIGKEWKGREMQKEKSDTSDKSPHLLKESRQQDDDYEHDDGWQREEFLNLKGRRGCTE